MLVRRGSRELVLLPSRASLILRVSRMFLRDSREYGPSYGDALRAGAGVWIVLSPVAPTNQSSGSPGAAPMPERAEKSSVDLSVATIAPGGGPRGSGGMISIRWWIECGAPELSDVALRDVLSFGPAYRFPLYDLRGGPVGVELRVRLGVVLPLPLLDPESGDGERSKRVTPTGNKFPVPISGNACSFSLRRPELERPELIFEYGVPVRSFSLQA